MTQPLRILVAGATGAVGRALVPLLLDRGHDVAALARRPVGVDPRAVPLAVDALDRAAMIAAALHVRPDVVIHQLTALPARTSLRRFDRDFAQTDRLRTEGTDVLIEAARRGGARRFVAQGYCGWPFARTGSWVKDEDAPFDPDPPARLRGTLQALARLEATITGAADLRGTVLRYGSFYGPGTHLAPGSAMAEMVRRRRFPIVGDGAGVWSFAHIADVAMATALAAEQEHVGVFNVVDDEPAPVREWLPVLARAMGARPPRRLPMWPARLLLPEHLRVMMTEVRGGSNTRFKQAFGWQPRYPSWRDGFAAVFAEVCAPGEDQS